MKKALLIYMILLTLILSACAPTKEHENSIEFILFSQQDEDVTQWIANSWDLASSAVQIGDQAICTYEGKQFWEIKQWVGKSFLLPTQQSDILVSKSEEFTFSFLIQADYGLGTYVNEGIKIFLTADRADRNVLEYNAEITNQELHISGSLEHPYSELNVGIDDFHVVGVGLYDNEVYLFFTVLERQAHEVYICATQINVDTGNTDWSDLLVVPADHADNLFISATPSNCSFWEGRLYLCSYLNLICYNPAENSLVVLDSPTNQAIRVVPNASQIGGTGESQPIFLVGSTPAGVMIVQFPVFTRDGLWHLFYFAVQNDKFVGAIDISGETLFVYNADGKISETQDLSNLHLPSTPALFPVSMSSY